MHTSIGRVLNSIHQHDLRDEMHGGEEIAHEDKQVMLDALSNAAHYVIDDKIVELAADRKTEKSMRAMLMAGIHALPFDPMLIEFRGISGHAQERAFVRLQSFELVPGRTPRKGDIYAYVYCLLPSNHPDQEWMILSMRAGLALTIHFSEDNFTVAMGHHDDDDAKAEEHLGMTVVCAMFIAFLMLNTKGVVTEHIETERLNRARSKVGKPRINPYTVVRVGHIYDKYGNAHDVGTSGRHMPVHWRSAHVRNVRYGTYKEPAKHRPKLIPACLVNFDPQDGFDPPLPRREMTM